MYLDGGISDGTNSSAFDHMPPAIFNDFQAEEKTGSGEQPWTKEMEDGALFETIIMVGMCPAGSLNTKDRASPSRGQVPRVLSSSLRDDHSKKREGEDGRSSARIMEEERGIGMLLSAAAFLFEEKNFLFH